MSLDSAAAGPASTASVPAMAMSLFTAVVLPPRFVGQYALSRRASTRQPIAEDHVMPLHGKGMLIVFNQVKARDERDLNEWYNREHIDERVNLPGFHRGRRYVAVRGSPKYLATYECDTVEDLATPGYLALLANQTPWTQAVMARFTKFNRLTVRVPVDLAHGSGGAVAAVRFTPSPSNRRALVAWLRGTALPKAIARPGMVGAMASENDLE